MLAFTGTLPSAGFRSAPRVAASRASVVCPSIKLYVGNLSWSAQKEDLQELFSKYGNLEDVYIASDRETGRSRGFGFVTFESDEAGQSAIQGTNETDFLGRTLRVNEAQPLGERPEGGRGYGRGRGRGYGRRDDGGDGGERRSYGRSYGDREGGERRSYGDREGRSYGDRDGGFRGGRGGGGRGRGGYRRRDDDSYGSEFQDIGGQPQQQQQAMSEGPTA